MARGLDVINVAAPTESQRIAPVAEALSEERAMGMPAACESGGCGGGGDALPRPVMPAFAIVTVDAEEIAPEAIAQEMPHHPAPDGHEAWRQAARALVTRHLLLREAVAQGLVAEDEDGTIADDDRLLHALLDQRIARQLPSDAECERFYAANRHRFRTPTLWEASHILIEPGENADEARWAAAETQARTIIAEVGHDRAAFAEAARELSDCPSKLQDGSLGQLRRGDLVDSVQTAIESTPLGTVRAEPVRSRFGWHVVRVERRIDGQLLPLEVVKLKIIDMLEARAWTVGAMQLVQELIARADVRGVDMIPDPAAAAA